MYDSLEMLFLPEERRNVSCATWYVSEQQTETSRWQVLMFCAIVIIRLLGLLSTSLEKSLFGPFRVLNVTREETIIPKICFIKKSSFSNCQRVKTKYNCFSLVQWKCHVKKVAQSNWRQGLLRPSKVYKAERRDVKQSESL